MGFFAKFLGVVVIGQICRLMYKYKYIYKYNTNDTIFHLGKIFIFSKGGSMNKIKQVHVRGQHHSE